MHTNTHTHAVLMALCLGLPVVSRYQNGKTNLDFTEARDSEWQWHQLDHMQVCTSLQTDNHASTPPLKFFTGRMPFLPPNQQRQSTEGTKGTRLAVVCYYLSWVEMATSTAWAVQDFFYESRIESTKYLGV